MPFVLLAGPGESLRAANSSADCNQCGCTTIYVVHHAALCCTCHCATVPRLYCNIPSIHASKGIVVVKPSPTRHGLREASTMPCSTVVIAMARERGDVFPTCVQYRILVWIYYGRVFVHAVYPIRSQPSPALRYGTFFSLSTGKSNAADFFEARSRIPDSRSRLRLRTGPRRPVCITPPVPSALAHSLARR